MSFSIKTPKFKKTYGFLEGLERFDPYKILNKAGKQGVIALSAATPVDSGDAAGSWGYKIEGDKKRYKLIWTNTAMAGRAPLVLILQYGHATKSGYFLSGRDFINPALKSVYDSVNKQLIEEVLR